MMKSLNSSLSLVKKNMNFNSRLTMQNFPRYKLFSSLNMNQNIYINNPYHFNVLDDLNNQIKINEEDANVQPIRIDDDFYQPFILNNTSSEEEVSVEMKGRNSKVPHRVIYITLISFIRQTMVQGHVHLL